MSYITPFWGEFMVMPAPLEWSMNYCSHACAYCFANLNSPTRKGDADKAMRQVAEAGKRGTYTDLLLAEGYPVCISNKVDPFSESNWRECLPVMQTMRDRGMPIYFQTKFGKGVDEILKGLPPSVWFVSIAFQDDNLRKLIEPGTPSIDERFARIKQLTEMGHRVIVAVNPCVTEWVGDVYKMAERIKAAGGEAVWLAEIHINPKQLIYMPKGGQKAIGDVVLQKSFGKKADPEDYNTMAALVDACKGVGIESHGPLWTHRSDFFVPFRDLYPKTYPVMQDFINWCFDNNLTRAETITFDEFLDVMDWNLPTGKHRIGDYVRASNYRIVENASDWTDIMTFRQLLYIAWTDIRFNKNPTWRRQLAYAAEKDKNGEWVHLTDDKGYPMMVFDPFGFDDYYFEFKG